MAKRCVFCGKTLSFFDEKTLLCGNALQSVCSACWAEMQDLDQEARARRALETGRAAEPEVIQTFLDSLERRRQAVAQAREALKTDKRCLRCGGVMERYGRKKFHLGEESLFGTVARDGLFAAWLTVDVLRCADCGRAEFFLPDPPELEDVPKAPEEQVVCPVCGARHSPLINCPNCAMNRRTTQSEKPRGGGKKPPWEK